MAGTMNARLTALGGLLICSALAVAACVPQDKNDFAEVGQDGDSFAGPPAFPETGAVPPELLVEGLVYDFTVADADLDLWVPPTDEARCAAEKIVQNHGKRLSDLGYEAGRTGAGINDIALQPEERVSISSLFQSCVNTVEAISSLFMGGGHMSADEALCMGRGLDEAGMASALFDAWLVGATFDPFEDEGALAKSILDYTDVCLPDTAFTWYGVEYPGSDQVQGVEGESESDADLPGSAGNITTTTERRPTGG